MNSKSFNAQIGLTILCLFIAGCNSSPGTNSQHSTKFKQYYLQGEQVYLKNCSNCHQKNGNGLGLIFPPLNKSDFIQHHFEEVICLIKNGKKGELIVNGKSFNKPMPALASLTSLEIAEVTTYIYNTWGNERGIIDIKTVEHVLDSCKR